MKKINISFISMVLSLVICVNLQAVAYNSKIITSSIDQSSRCLFRISYVNSDGQQSITTFDYDSLDHPKTAIWELLDGSRNSLDQFIYDEKGRLIRKDRKFSDSLTIKYIWEYGDDDQLLKELYQSSNGVAGTTNHIYNKKGFIKKSICKNHEGWFNGEIVYYYEKGRKSGAEIFQKAINSGKIQYVYNASGNIIKENWQFNNDWNQSVSYEYHNSKHRNPSYYTSSNVFIINDDSYCIALENYDYSGKSSGPSYFEYEENGKLVGKKFVRSDGLTTQTVFLYDADKQLTKSYRAFADGRIGIFTYKFNDDRKLEIREYKVTNGKSGKEVYKYDEKSLLIKAHYQNFDSWLTGTITLQHDEDGNLSTGFFEGEDDFNADITFQYDDLNHLVMVHWNFTFGSTQTYTFQYKGYTK